MVFRSFGFISNFVFRSFEFICLLKCSIRFNNTLHYIMKRIKFLIAPILLSLQLTGYSQEQNYLYTLYFNEQYDQLICETKSRIKNDSLNTDLSYILGLTYSELSKYDSALYYFQNALKTDNTNLKLLSATGRIYTALGRYNEAIKTYKIILATDSSMIKPRTLLANLYLQQDNHAEAIIHYEYLAGRDTTNYYYYKQLGRCHQELGSPDLAIINFLKAYNLNSYDLGIVSRLINLYMRKKDFGNGLDLANKGLAIDSMNIDLRKQRAYLFYLTEQYNQAIEDFHQVMVAGDSSHFTCKYRGLCFYEEKFFWDAREHLQIAYVKDTLDAETTFFLGLAYRWSTEEEEGVKYLNKTLELLNPDPRDLSRVYIELAGVYQVLHQFNMTLESYKKALEYSDNKDLIYFRLAQVYEENLHDKKMAIEYYQKYLDNKTTDHQLYNSSSETMETLLEFVQSRINRLKEELFFEE